MKTGINNSVKRALSLVLVFAMLVGCLFTANVGININASAATESEGKTVYLDDATLTNASKITGLSLSSFTKDGEYYIVDTVEKLAYVCVRSFDAAGLKFKVADDIDAFVLQTKSYASGIKDLSDYSEVKEYFENNEQNRFNWARDINTNGFRGYFDGNGVKIYGMYANGCLNDGQQPALFPLVDGGASDGTSFEFTYNGSTVKASTSATGTTIKNLEILNSYAKGWRRVGILIGCDNWTEGGYKVEGFITINNIVMGNCYVECVDNYTNSSGVAKTNSRKAGEAGLFTGSIGGNDYVNISNILAYGSYGCYKTNETDEEATSLLYFAKITYKLTSDGGHTGDVYSTFHDAIIFGDNLYQLTTHKPVEYTYKVYTNSDAIKGTFEGVTKLFDEKTLYGAPAMAWAEALEWGTEWFAVEGELPTPIEPASYIPASEKPDNKFAGGAGTKVKPYIIRSVDQLYQMVNEQSYSGTYVDTHTDYSTDPATPKSTTSYYSKYYKVADDVKSLYINKAETQAEIVALASSSTCNVWAPTASFFAGNFDGNGVTIYGMISKNGKGFVNKIDGTHAAIKNVHFKAAYVNGGGNRAAVVTTSFGSFGHGYKASADATQTTYFNRMNDPNGEDVNRFLIANIAVTESYIHSDLGTDSDYVATAGGIISLTDTPPMLYVRNCFFDGVSSTLTDGVGTTAGANTTSMKAGIATMQSGTQTNRWNISNCISINEYPVSMKTGGEYGRLNADSSGGSCEISTMYGPVNAAVDTTKYPKFSAVIALETKNTYTLSDALMLDWAYTWDLVKVSDTRTAIPMVVGLANEEAGISYSQLIADQFGNIGANEGNGVPGLNGRYGWQHLLSGTGTKDDPYLITNALELARAVGCGASRAGQPLHYKLTCDIDLSGSTWISQESVESNYHYVPFIGTIDGAGYAIYGLAATDATAAGFIPVLDGGTVKNLHFRNCYAGSAGTAGIVAGQVNSGTITGCSVEGSKTVGSSNHITGNWGFANVTNSYIYFDGTATYVLEDKDALVGVESVTDLYTNENTDAVWYKVGNSIARHTSFAKAHSVTDVDGDGVVEEKYVGTDIAALRNFLLKETGYDNIYADVNKDGAINISDLVVLRRQVVGTYNTVKDGFWRNVELGKVAIYYDENDNYDFARRLQLYLETVASQTGINKYTNGTVVAGTEAGTPASNGDADTYVNIKTDTTLTYDQYKVEYNATTAVVTISGGSFTAVEEAVNEFIKNSQEIGTTMTVYTTNDVKSILDTADATDTGPKHYKSSKTVWDGTKDVTVYYAWGDEFEGDGDDSTKDSFSTDNWQIRNYRNEGDLNGIDAISSDAGNTRYLNLESPTVDAIDDLWEVSDGKLKIWRGINTDAYGSWDNSAWKDVNGEPTGYKPVTFTLDDEGKSDFGREIDDDDIYIDPGLIQTSKTMLFKQGYSEMRAALPHDGHAFPAWWFMSGTAHKATSNVENHQLFGKVYSLNNGDTNPITGKVNNPNADTRWDGTTMTMNPLDLTTYKYQMPQAYLELDIVEFMQAGTGKQYTQTNSKLRNGITNGDYRDYIQLTIHKYYSQHVTDGKLYLPDWSTGGYVSGYSGITQTDFVNTAGSGNDGTTFIHRYDPSRTTSNHPYTVTTGSWFWEDETSTAASYSIAKAIENGAISNSSARPNDMYTYGFYWTVNGNVYDLYIYVDFDNDGNMESNEVIYHVDETNGHESTLTDPTYDVLKNDGEVWNQYAYMLIDNSFYTSNPYGTATRTSTIASFGSETGVTMYEDLLTQDNTWETTTFDLEYVRVYQADGRRDLVTPDTEAFNTNNHFGY